MIDYKMRDPRAFGNERVTAVAVRVAQVVAGAALCALLMVVW